MEARKNPIILIPGIQGTTLCNTNDVDFVKMYSGFKKHFKNVHDVALKDDGISDKKSSVIVERADVENLAYSEIVNYFRDLGYEVFIFGYDWRLSNAESAKKLNQFVEKLKNKIDEHVTFNFLTHSMGGLVFSAYLKLLRNNEAIDEVVNKAVLTATPFLGSLEAAFNLIIGKSKLFNTSDDFRKIARTFPGVYELCPVYDGAYTFEDIDKSLHNIDDFTKFDYYWQHEPYEEGGFVGLKEKNDLMTKRFAEIAKIRSAKGGLIFDFEKLPEDLRKRFVILTGSGKKTFKQVKIFNQDNAGRLVNYFDFDEIKENKEGDGTVHHKSSTVFKDVITTIDIKSKFFETLEDSRFIGHDWHAFFLNNGRVQNVIKRFFLHEEEQLANFYANNWFESIGGGAELLQ